MKPEEIAYMLVNDDGELISMPDGMQVFRLSEAIGAEAEANIVSGFSGVPVHVRRVLVEVIDD